MDKIKIGRDIINNQIRTKNPTMEYKLNESIEIINSK